jgi:hypothetical protein
VESVVTILEESAAPIFTVEERSGRTSLPFQRKLPSMSSGQKEIYRDSRFL